MIFGYAIECEDEFFFFTKEEMLESFENYLKSMKEELDFTEEEILEITKFSVVFDSKEELEKFF